MPTQDQPLLYTRIESPIGELLAVNDGPALAGLYMQEGSRPATIQESWMAADEPFGALRDQLGEYFTGERAAFELPLAASGTPFQRRVWRALREIPYGQTASYGELARRIGRPTASRAIGMANGGNPIAIVVPCHRVVGADGRLTGYAGGLERKRTLLELEAATLEGGEAGPGAGEVASPTGRYTLIGADGKPYRSAVPGTLGGHRRNHVYGRLDCSGARRWIAKGHYVKHRVFFADEATAIAAGYRPCGGCMRERYQAWKAGQVEARA